MDLNNIEVLKKIYKLSKQIHPDLTVKNIYQRGKVVLYGLRNINPILKWYATNDNPKLLQALERFPNIHGAIYWPYINKNWQIERKLSVIDTHYRLLTAKSEHLFQVIFQDICLVTLDDYFEGLYLQLDKAKWFIREGEVVLNLFHQETRLYSIAFTLGLEAGERVIYIGAIQGANTGDVLDIYRQITRTLHGMRPRDFMVSLLKILCKNMGINKIWAISDEARQHNADYFGGSHKEKVVINYDEIWQEQGGANLDNGFYEISTEINFREDKDIPVKKRATYRRRYAMLIDLDQKIARQCIPSTV